MDETTRQRLLDIDGQLMEGLKQRREVVQQYLASRGGARGLSLAQLSTEMKDVGVPLEVGRDFQYHVVDASLRGLAERFRVAYLGPIHSYSYLAGSAHFGQQADFVPVASIVAVFEEVHRGHSGFGIVPIQNSTDGRIIDSLTLFGRYATTIVGEMLLPIHHCLLGRIPRNEVREVHSKPQALSQCRQWLSQHLPDARLVENGSTAGAARLAREQAGVAAIASREAAQPYGLNVIDANIEDFENNQTRFVILGTEPQPPTGQDKTSLLFRVAHHPGALADAIHLFRDAGINLTWIESLPIPESPSDYEFFIEFHGHRDQPEVGRCLATLKETTSQLQVLGSYPRAMA